MTRVVVGNSTHTTESVFDIPSTWTEADAVESLVSAWPYHSTEPPMWVWSPNEGLARVIADEFGCPVGSLYPENWFIVSTL